MNKVVYQINSREVLMMEKILHVDSNNILGVESMIFLSAFILTFLFVAEFVPVFFAFLITIHELSHHIERGMLNDILQSQYVKGSAKLYSLISFD